MKIKEKLEFNRIWFLIKLIKTESPSFFILMMIQVIYKGCMPLIGTYISAYLVKQVVLSFNEDINIILPLCLEFGYFLSNSLFDTVYSLFYKLCSEKFNNGIKNRIMIKSKDIDLSFFDMPECYGKLENAKREVGSRPLIVVNSFCESISRLISMIGFLIILLSFLSTLSINTFFIFMFFIGTAVFVSLINLKHKNKSYQYMKKSSKQRRQMNYYSELVLNKDNVKEIKIYNLSDIFIDKYNKIFKKYYQGMKELYLQEGKINVVAAIAMTLIKCILFYYIIVNVNNIEDFTIYTSALNSIAASISVLIISTGNIYEGMLFIDNLRDFLNENSKMEVEDFCRQITYTKKHIIEFCHVSFQYPGSDKYVLQDIDIKMETGQFVIFIGLNGAGKSTLIKLLARLYDPTEGIILLDGYDLKEYNLKELYKLFGVVFQDYGKYALSIKENICFGKGQQNGDIEEILSACEKANATTFIQGIKNSYESNLTRFFEDDGIDLSIGQWQKLALARAFFSNGDILILDEPTASLDIETEQKVLFEIKNENSNKLIIMISHKLLDIDDAAQIILLEDGKIIVKGRHGRMLC